MIITSFEVSRSQTMNIVLYNLFIRGLSESHMEYLDNQLRGFDVNWKQNRGDIFGEIVAQTK